jgi:hypothetical protein
VSTLETGKERPILHSVITLKYILVNTADTRTDTDVSLPECCLKHKTKNIQNYNISYSSVCVKLGL